MRLALLALLAAALSVAAEREACHSGLKGDFQFKTCASFCKQARAASHCKFCKCQQCGFCSGGTPAPAPRAVVAAVPAPAVTPAVAAATTTEASAPVATASAATPDPAVAPAATASSEGGGHLLPTSAAFAVVLALICYALAASRPRGHKSIAIGPEDEEPDEELLPYEEASKRAAAAASEPSPPPSAALADENPEAVQKRVLCVAFLCLQYSAYALLRRYATGILHEGWSFSSVLGVGEAIKFAISLYMISQKCDASEAPPGPLQERTRFLLLNSGKMAVPAILYLMMNMLGFVSLRRVDAGTFAIVQQSKIFFTAFFARVFLARVLSVPKWCALCCLVCGVVSISLHANPEYACFSAVAPAKPGSLVEGGPFQYLIGVVAVTMDSALSGFATIYFEKVLKTTVLTVWDRNLQLAFWSMTIYLPWAFYDHATNPFYGWSWLTVCVAALGAVGGILVALVIKYADGLAKNLSTASSIVITTACSHFLFGAPMSSTIILGSLIVIISGYNYQNVH